MAGFFHKLLHYFSLTTIVRCVITTGYVFIILIGLALTGLILTPILIWIPQFWWIALLFLVSYLALVVVLTILWVFFFGFATFGIGPNHVNARVRKRLLLRPSKEREDDPLLSDENENEKIVRFGCVSDTHNKHRDIKLPKCDVFIIAGDFSYKGTHDEVLDFCKWLVEIAPNFRAIIVVPGNHDLTMDTAFYDRDWEKWHPGNRQDAAALQHMVRHALEEYNKTAPTKTEYHYLLDETIEYEGIVIHGAPWVLPLMNLQMAFTSKTQDELYEHWKNTIPQQVDLLITHGPPLGIRDRMMFLFYRRSGDSGLASAVQVRQPKVHVFGHTHETYGVTFKHGLTYINCSTNTMTYQPVHPPIVFDLLGEKPSQEDHVADSLPNDSNNDDDEILESVHYDVLQQQEEEEEEEQDEVDTYEAEQEGEAIEQEQEGEKQTEEEEEEEGEEEETIHV